jgi:hypothetical protein
MNRCLHSVHGICGISSSDNQASEIWRVAGSTFTRIALTDAQCSFSSQNVSEIGMLQRHTQHNVYLGPLNALQTTLQTFQTNIVLMILHFNAKINNSPSCSIFKAKCIPWSLHLYSQDRDINEMLMNQIKSTQNSAAT